MRADILEILQKVTDAGFEVALVGGAVREMLSKEDVEPGDWDLATNATPEEILKIFPNSFNNNRFGTVGIKLKDDVVEITTYRRETGYSDRRHPDKVEWGEKLEEDLARRDFTVNAMALRFIDGELVTNPVDPFGGQKDLNDKVIRAVGNADERFKEDALRLLRAVRFAATLGFEIEEKTAKAIEENAESLAEISGERVRVELLKIVDCENSANGLFLSKKLGLLKIILPELDICFEVEQKSPQRHHIFDVGTHCVMSMHECPSTDPVVRFATLLHDIGKAKVADITAEGVRTFYNHEVVGGRQVLKIADRLHFSNDDREKIYKLVRWHQFSVNENQTDKALRRFIKNIGIDLIDDMMDLRVGDRVGGGVQEPEGWRLKLFRERLKEVLKKPFTVADLKVNGRDVMKILDMKPGPKVGEILNKLFEEVLEDDKKNERKYLLAQLEKLNEKQ